MSETKPNQPGIPSLHDEGPRGATPRIRSCLVIIIALMLIGGFFGARQLHIGAKTDDKSKKEKSPVPVVTAKVEKKNVPVELHIVGSVAPYSTVPVISQVTGVLVKFHIRQGDFVYEGQPLFSIDSRPQRAAVQQAHAVIAKDQAQISQASANLARDMAMVRQAQATLAKDLAMVNQAKSNLARDLGQLPLARRAARRYKQLLAEGFVTSEQSEQQVTNLTTLDGTLAADRAAIQAAEATVAADRAAVASAQATALADGASVRSLEAAVQADRAAAENATIQLGYTEIRSPIKGRTGTLNVYEGTLVKASDTNPLITIDQIQPIRVSFAVPEKYLTEIRERQERSPLTVSALAPDAKHTAEKGTVSFIENTVDTTTGTITLRADFPNLDRKLWPGQFVNVNLLLRRVPEALTIPSPAVQPGQNGDFVFVVKDNNTVEVRNIVVDFTFGDISIIKSGLAAGETVVSDGQLQLTPGATVQVGGKSSRKPGPSGSPLTPTPAAPQGRETPETPSEGGHRRGRAADKTTTPGPR